MNSNRSREDRNASQEPGGSSAPIASGERLDLATIRRAVSSVPLPRLQNVLVLADVTSTNDVARTLIDKMIADESDLGRTLVVALRQTAGRGRGGRPWKSGKGNALAMSLVSMDRQAASRVRIPVEAGVHMARALSSAFGIDVRLKWPNDLLSRGRKLGGILVEVRTSAGEDGVAYLIVGVGLNITSSAGDFEREELPFATSLALELAAAGAGKSTESALADILSMFDGLLTEPLSDLADAFEAVTAHARGAHLTVRDGPRMLSGTYLGLTKDGFLRLKTSAGEESILSGDVVIL